MSIFSITISYFIGIIGGPIFVSKMVPLLFLFFLFVKIRNKDKKNKKISLSLFLILLLVATVSNRIFLQKEKEYQELHQTILQGESSQKIQVIGKIIKDPQEKPYKTIYQLKVEELKVNGKKVKIKNPILLQVKKQTTLLEWGDIVSVTGEWEKVETQRNTGGFDYEQYLKIQGISGIVVTEESNIKKQQKKTAFSIDFMIHQIKDTIRTSIKTVLPQEEAGLLIGILLGDTTELTPQTKEDFRNSSLSHMLAVSGSHTGYVIAGVALLLKKIRIGSKKATVITIFFLLFFSLLTGNTPSVERASLMAIYRYDC